MQTRQYISLGATAPASKYKLVLRKLEYANLNHSIPLGSLALVRALLSPILLLSAAITLAQTGSGSYSPNGSTPQSWSINANHTLIWNAAPYIPVGLRVDGTAENVARAKSLGFSDVIVDLPAGGSGWQETIKALEAAQMRYLISVSSLTPMAEGVAIDPAGYRVTGITQAGKIDIRLPGASSALTVVVNRRDASVESIKRYPVLEGKLTMDVKPIADLEQVVLIYPKMRSLEQPDLWEAMDEHRDRLLHTLGVSGVGPGLRGIVNPFGRMANWGSNEPHFVPTSPYFRLEFAAYLKQKYRTLETAMKAWSMTASDIDSFEALARLTPLWSGATRGIPQLWDTETDRLYNCNNAKCSIWSDISEVISAASSRRYARIVSAIQSVVDVPVVQEWSGWSPMYELSNPSLDGIGMRPSGTSPSALLDSASRATSTILRWKKSGWLLATDIAPGSDQGAVGQISPVLDDLTSLGARGWFLRDSTPEINKAFSLQTPRSGDASVAAYAPLALFFPENAANPAVPQQLPGGRWWLPSPADGNRINYSSTIQGYRYNDGGQSFTAIWTTDPAARVKFRMMDPKSAVITALDPSAAPAKINKKGFEATLSSVPLVISGTTEIPVPEPAYAETLARATQLFSTAEGSGLDATQPRFLFKDALDSYDRNPGASFNVMRQQYERLDLRVGRFMWVEAELSRNNNFSEVIKSPATSSGAFLSLNTQIANPPGGYLADYPLNVKSTQDVEVWLAARIPQSQRDRVSITVAGQVLKLTGEPIGLYGNGFGWYHLGTTRLGGSNSSLQLKVIGESADMAFDVILLDPNRFTPNGVRIPDAISFAPVKK